MVIEPLVYNNFNVLRLSTEQYRQYNVRQSQVTLTLGKQFK